MKKYLKLCCTDWKNASRDKREMSVCQELGMETLVMTKGEPGDKFKKDVVDGFDVLRFSTRPLGTKIPNMVNRIASTAIWPFYVKKIKPDIISCHDITALNIGYLSTLFMRKKNKPVLVYDAHEFELGRNSNRGKLELEFMKFCEHHLIDKCAFSIMVNEAIVNEIVKIYNPKKTPLIVRSTPNLWRIDNTETSIQHKQFCDELNIPENSFIVMYHGGLLPTRGIETLIKVLNINKNIYAVVLGNGTENYVTELKNLAKSLNVSDRILFKDAVPIDILWKYVGAADLGLIMAPAVVKNNLFSLPNKFFENIQSETPVVCPNYPAMKPIVDKYKFGLTCDPTNIEEVNSCIEKIRTNPDLYNELKENVKKAKRDLCWENEKQILVDAYKKLI